MIHEFCVKHNYSKRPKSRSRESRTSTNWRHQTEIKTTNGFHLPAKLIFNGFFVHLQFISSENCPCKLPSHFRKIRDRIAKVKFWCTLYYNQLKRWNDHWLAVIVKRTVASWKLCWIPSIKRSFEIQLEVQLCSWTRNWCTAVNSQRWGGRGKFRWVIKLLQLSW